MNEPIGLSAMHIADKVNRFVNARYYSIQLAALEKSASNIGCGFVQRGYADAMPPEIEEHLAIAVLIARETYVAPKLAPKDIYRSVESRLEQGYAIAYLREFLAALDAVGLRFHIQEQGINWRLMEYERWSWQPETGLEEPSPFPQTADEEKNHGLNNVDEFISQFMEINAAKGSQPS